MTNPERDPIDELAQTMRRIDARLPDTDKARGAQVLIDRLTREVERRETPPPSRRGVAPLAWASLGALAAAALLLGWFGIRSPRPATTARSLQSEPKLVPAPAVAAPELKVTDPRAILQPLATSPALARLVAGVGQDARALLAECGRLVLRGPGEVVVEESSSPAIVLGLVRGTLTVSFDHDCGRGLRVRTKDALVRVTGTVFAVHAQDGPTRIAVARGEVKVETDGPPVTVGAGRSWQVGARKLTSPNPAMVLALNQLSPSEGARAPTTRTLSGSKVSEHGQPSLASDRPLSEDGQAPRLREEPSPMLADAESLYRAAENSLARGRTDTAVKQLRELVDQHATHSLASPAMYELGRLAFAEHDFAAARAEFGRVRASTRAEAARFHEPAAFFLCRSEQELGNRAGAIACLQDFRRDFPSSPHAADALAALATLHLDRQDCAAALPILREYRERYPHGSEAKAMGAAEDSCKAALSGERR